jgi:hypothetical protein
MHATRLRLIIDASQLRVAERKTPAAGAAVDEAPLDALSGTKHNGRRRLKGTALRHIYAQSRRRITPARRSVAVFFDASRCIARQQTQAGVGCAMPRATIGHCGPILAGIIPEIKAVHRLR